VESEQLLSNYWIYAGSSLDRALLVKFMQLSYQELFPEQNFSHLARTVEQYFSKETPLWWVNAGRGAGDKGDNYPLPITDYQLPIQNPKSKIQNPQ
jgi:hypothetical protein